MNTSDSVKKRILVVEDEPAIGNICRIVLSGEGFEVDVAVNCEIAQDMIKSKQYDVCLLDIRLPVMTGIELYRWLKKEGSELTRGVIFTSGSVMGEDTHAFIEQSGRPFLPKPFTLDELVKAVTDVLQQINSQTS